MTYAQHIPNLAYTACVQWRLDNFQEDMKIYSAILGSCCVDCLTGAPFSCQITETHYKTIGIELQYLDLLKGYPFITPLMYRMHTPHSTFVNTTDTSDAPDS